MTAADTLDVNAFIRPAAAADRLGLSVNYLAKLRIYGGGPKFSKCGAAVRYRISDLDAFMAACAHESTSSYATTG